MLYRTATKEVRKLADHYFTLQCERLGPITRLGKPGPQLRALLEATTPKPRRPKNTVHKEART